MSISGTTSGISGVNQLDGAPVGSNTPATGSFTTVSGANLNISGTTSANTISVSGVSAVRINTVTLSANVANILTVSANAAYLTTQFAPVAIISAAGTTQATATLCNATISRLQGTADGTDTGYALMANMIGRTQFLVHEGTVSANLYPPVGGKINALGTNAAFAMAASTPYTVIYTVASSVWVK